MNEGRIPKHKLTSPGRFIRPDAREALRGEAEDNRLNRFEAALSGGQVPIELERLDGDVSKLDLEGELRGQCQDELKAILAEAAIREEKAAGGRSS